MTIFKRISIRVNPSRGSHRILILEIKIFRTFSVTWENEFDEVSNPMTLNFWLRCSSDVNPRSFLWLLKLYFLPLDRLSANNLLVTEAMGFLELTLSLLRKGHPRRWAILVVISCQNVPSEVSSQSREGLSMSEQYTDRFWSILRDGNHDGLAIIFLVVVEWRSFLLRVTCGDTSGKSTGRWDQLWESCLQRVVRVWGDQKLCLSHWVVIKLVEVFVRPVKEHELVITRENDIFRNLGQPFFVVEWV